MSLVGKSEYTIAVIGQPNCGKTTLFNALTGSNQYVGNWSGVTVEKKSGIFELEGARVILQDLPGTYSLIPWSIDEKVSHEYLFSEKFDALINIIEAPHLERQLYLTFQLLTLGIPMIVAVNMMDELTLEGKLLDAKRLEELLGVPVVAMSARIGEGIEELKTSLFSLLKNSDGILNNNKARKVFPQLALSPETELLVSIENYMAASDDYLNQVHKDFPNVQPMTCALLYLLNDTGMKCYADAVKDETQEQPVSALSKVLIVAKSNYCIKKKASETMNIDEFVASEMGIWLYGVARGVTKECIMFRKDNEYARKNTSALIDKVVLHPLLGIPVFFAVMFLLFQTTFAVGDLLIGYLEIGLAMLQGLTQNIKPEWLAALISNGIVGGAGNVLLLTPYIFIMFLLLAFLEDSGYMARIAFVTDHIMHKLGLHGRAFIPLVMGFGCNVPALMAVRTLDNERDRIKASLMIPFMSCSARLPVYVLFAGAFFGKQAGLVVFSLYFAGIAAALLTGWVFSRTLIREKSEGVIMELPPYRMPLLKNMLLSSWTRTKSYIEKAGTVILLLSAVLWVLSYFPAEGEGSILAVLGRGIAWIFKPLGFDWRMTVGLISGFAAKEVVISTLGILYAGGASLQTLLPTVMNLPTALGYLVFIVLYTPCAATLAVMRTETGKARWVALSVVWGLVLAWVSAFFAKLIAEVVL